MNNNKYNVISELRALRPDRYLSLDEARVVAERQAARLLELLDVDIPVRVAPSDLTSRLRVVREKELPEHVAGSSHWTGTRWVISINSGNPKLRQRFTVFHELHHILEHPFRRFDGEAIAEVVADHFAACVLMPKASVKAAWFARYVSRVLRPLACLCRADLGFAAGVVDPGLLG